MTIKRYNPEKKECKTVFYIQSHGLNAGKPLKKPIPNSWEIDINCKNAFEICYVVFNSKILEIFIRGSVIPFISLSDYKKIITPYLEHPSTNDNDIINKLLAIQKIDLELENIEKKKILYKQLKTCFAHEVIKN